MAGDGESDGDALVESVVRSPLWQKHDEFDRRLLRVLIETYPQEALKVLLETGALERFADCGRCAGSDACRWVHAMNEADIPECVPVYRLVPKEDR